MRLSQTSKILLLILFAILLFFHTRGIIIHDEGYILNSARLVNQGEVIYRDFHFGYTPGSVFLTALSFKLFGQSILASRLLMLILSFASSILIFLILKKITLRNEYGIIGTLIYIAWGPSHINFAWPVMFVVPFSLLTIYLSLKAKDIPKKSSYNFLLGFLCFMIFLFKQNFGFILLPILFFQFFRKSNKINSILLTLYGFMWGLILFILYLLATDSFKYFLLDFYNYSIVRILFENSLTTPYFYFYTGFLKSFARNVFYLLPLFFAIIANLTLLHRKKYQLIFIPIYLLLFYIFHIRPTTDYVHLAPVLSLMGIPLSIIMNQYPFSYVKLGGYLLTFALILSGFSSSLFYGYYKWDTPLYRNNSFLYGNNANVFVNKKYFSEINKLNKVIENNTDKNDLIYADAYAPLLYFLLDRNQPTGNDYPGFVNGIKYENQTVRSFIVNTPKIILLISEDPKSQVYKFVTSKYEFLDIVGDYKIYRLK